MSSHSNSNTQEIKVIPRDPKKIKEILRVTYILAIATTVEFFAAGFLPRGAALTIFFVVLTFLKTFYIVGEFMHLKHEAKTLIWSIVIPSVFIMWFILAMLMEGTSVFNVRTWIWG